MRPSKLSQFITILLSGGILAACGGGGGGNGGGTSAAPASVTTSSVGTITGFGSVYVNGIKFETDDTEYLVDDEDAFNDSALAVGMKVKVIGTVNEDGVTGHADRIIYDDDVEGPIDANSLQTIDTNTVTFTVLGLAVRAHATRTLYDDGAAFDTLAEGQVIEVSGYFDGNEIVASRIENMGNSADEYELKGTVTAYDGNSITLSLLNGESAGPFNTGPNTLLDIPSDPVGEFVEVKLKDQGGDLVVIRIESDDDNLPNDDEDEVHMHGILADDGDDGFLVNGVPLRINATTEFSPDNLENRLAAGIEVRVEGEMKNGVMIADEIETNDSNIEIEARIVDVNSSGPKSGSLTLDLGNGQTLEVQSGNNTLFEDDSESDLDDDGSFDLDELATGSDFADIDAYQDEKGIIVATRIKREDPDQKTRLKAPLEAFEAGSSVTMLGIGFTVGVDTEYELDGETATDAISFFNALSIGDTVKVKDKDTDGTLEEAELDD